MSPRKSISKVMRARVILAWSGRCAMCADRFEAGQRIEIDHIHQRATGGADDENNYRPLCAPCHRRKTAADARDRAHIRRLTGANKPRFARPIISRGFDTTKTRRMDGSVTERKAS